MGACADAGAGADVCVVRGCLGNAKSRQLPLDLAVYRSGVVAVFATLSGNCSLRKRRIPDLNTVSCSLRVGGSTSPKKRLALER